MLNFGFWIEGILTARIIYCDNAGMGGNIQNNPNHRRAAARAFAISASTDEALWGGVIFHDHGSKTCMDLTSGVSAYPLLVNVSKNINKDQDYQ